MHFLCTIVYCSKDDYFVLEAARITQGKANIFYLPLNDRLRGKKIQKSIHPLTHDANKTVAYSHTTGGYVYV